MSCLQKCAEGFQLCAPELGTLGGVVRGASVAEVQ